MSYFYQGSLILGRTQADTLQFIVKETTGYNNYAVVGYYEINGNVISTSLSTYLCPGQNYVLRISFPDSPSGSRFLASTGTAGTYQLVDGSNPFLLIVFRPIEGEIYSGRSFIGTLTSPNLPSVNNSYTITANSYYQLVGYTEQLPLLMSNCRACGCRTGRCSDYGVCVPTNVPCPSGALCGQQGGKCSGLCVDGYTCQLINGKYQCMPQSNIMNPIYIFSIVVAGLILALLFVLLVYYLTKK